jgi:hypothetical protein
MWYTIAMSLGSALVGLRAAGRTLWCSLPIALLSLAGMLANAAAKVLG